MTVLLIGVGADSTNTRPTPPVYPDGRFEYVPIPDEHASTEERRYANMTLRHRDVALSAYLDRVKRNGEWHRDFGEFPLHHDPNFEALTFGDPGKTRSQLLRLDAGDVLAFYAGLVREGETTPIHRYLVGYFTIGSVADFDALRGRDREAALRAHRRNAHVKQHRASGDPDRLAGLVIARGREDEPGRLLDRAVRISERRPNGHYYFAEEWASFLDPRSSYLGGYKNPIFCDVSPVAFVERIDREVNRLR
jgi:hypothetical protein